MSYLRALFLSLLFSLSTSPAQTNVWNTPVHIQPFVGDSFSSGYIDGKGPDARFSSPGALTLDKDGNLFVYDQGNFVLRKIAPDGTVSAVAGNPGHSGNADGQGVQATFKSISHIASSPTGDLFLLDPLSMTIRKCAPDQTVTTYALNLTTPLHGIVVDPNRNIFASYGNHIIRVTSTNSFETYAGSDIADAIDGPRLSASFYFPCGLGSDSNGNLYVADYGNGLIRKISADGNVSTLVGKLGENSIIDGPNDVARIGQVNFLTTDSFGYVYFVDQGSDQGGVLRKVGTDGSVLTLAGIRNSGEMSEGIGPTAHLSDPLGIAADSNGNVYYCGLGYNDVWKGAPYYGPPVLSFSGVSPDIGVGRVVTITQKVYGAAPLDIHWFQNDELLPGATNQSIIFSSFQPENTGRYRLTVTNAYGSAVSGEFLVQLIPPVITRQPTNQLVYLGQTAKFVTAATGLNPVSVQWLFNGEPITNIPSATNFTLTVTNVQTSQGGLYTARIRDDAGTNFSRAASLTVLAGPDEVVHTVGESFQLSPAIYGPAPDGFFWSRNGVPLTNQTGLALSFTNAQVTDGGLYRANIINSNKVLVSDFIRLFVNSSNHISTPIRLNGWNADAVLDQADPKYAVRFAGDIGPYWFENSPLNNRGGLPLHHTFTSLANPAVQFELQPYNSNNVAWLPGYNLQQTLTLETPGRYSSLSFLAASASGDGNGLVSLNFAEGSSRTNLSFSAPDWWSGYRCGVERHPAIAGFNRITDGVIDESPDGTGFALFESDLDLVKLGVSDKILRSITFYRPYNVAGASGIFAVSGTPNDSYSGQTILTQSIGGKVAAGGNITNSVQVQGAEPISYQWYLEGQEIPNATDSKLIVQNVGPANSGYYSVRVSDSTGSCLSLPGHIHIPGAPVIRSQITPGFVARVGPGSSLSLSITAAPDGQVGTLYYQWYKDGQALTNASARNNPFSFTTDLSSSGRYWCFVTNEQGSIRSDDVPVSVARIETDRATNLVGQTVELRAVTPVAAPQSIQWFKNHILLGGQTNSTLVLSNAVATDAGEYEFKASPRANDCDEYSLAINVKTPPSNFYFGDSNSAIQLNGTNLLLHLQIEENFDVHLEKSFDLTNWTAAGTVTSSTNGAAFQLPSDPASQTFYRAWVLPK